MYFGIVLYIQVDIAEKGMSSYSHSVCETTPAHQLADVSYLMADVEANYFLYKNVLNISQNAVIGWCWYW